MDLVNYFRLLWEQHVEWMRMTFLAMMHQLPEAEQTLQRLLRNAVDFANALGAFYGDEAAEEFQRLFTEHIRIAGELMQAAMAGDNSAMTDADSDHRRDHIRDLTDVRDYVLLEIEHFFTVYKDLEPGKSVEGASWTGVEEAEQEVRASFERDKTHGHP